MSNTTTHVTGLAQSVPNARVLKLAAFAILALVLLVAPALLYPVFLMKILCFALFASALNLLLGYTGLLSFGHATFFGGGAYFTAYCVKVLEVGPLAGILIGVGGAAVLGLVIGVIAIRRQGIYFAMTTLALSQLAYFCFLRAPFTNAEDGIQNVPRGTLFGFIDLTDHVTMYFFVLTVFAIGMFAIWRIVTSPFGEVVKAIRENEQRAISLGYNVNRYKLSVFTVSAALAGLAGSTKALVFQIATLTDVSWQMSGEAILMALLGGLGTLTGPSAGATVIVTMQNYLAATSVPVNVVIGVVFVISVLLFRKGIVGVFQKFSKTP